MLARHAITARDGKCCRVVSMPSSKSSEFGGDAGQPFPEDPDLKPYDLLRMQHQSDPMDETSGTSAAGDRVAG